MPIISVIVPVYKVEQYIHRCINSILEQSFADFELILIDDGSPDNCGTICDEYAKVDNRVRVIHQENGGLSAARNTGIDWVMQNSGSEWITFVDSDDWVKNNYLERLFEAVQKYGSKVSVGDFKKVSDTETVKNFETEIIEINPEELWISNRANATVAWGKLYGKNLFEEIRYPIGRIHEDEFVTYKLLFPLEKIAYVQECLYMYFQNDEGIMNTSWSLKRLDALDAFEEQLKFFKKGKFKQVFYDTERIYINDLAVAIEKIYCNYPEYINKEKLKNKLRWKICKYKKKIGLSVKNKSNIFLVAFPLFTKVYIWLRKKSKSLKEILQKYV